MIDLYPTATTTIVVAVIAHDTVICHENGGSVVAAVTSQ